MLVVMRLALLLVVAACGGGGSSPTTSAGSDAPAEPIKRLDLPRMDESARVTVLSKARPPALVWVDTRGRLAMGKVDATWTGDITPPATRVPEDVDITESVLKAVSGGVGQPYADSARQMLSERQTTRRSRLRMPTPTQNDPASPGLGRLDATPAVSDFANLDKLSPLVLATPSAPAPAVVAVLRRVGGTLAVDHLGKLAVLDVAFVGYQEPTRVVGSAPWIEVSVDDKGIHLRRFPEEREVEVAWSGAAIDRVELAKARTRLDDTAKVRVDVVVSPATTAQTLVELLAALHAIEVKTLAVAEGPDSIEDRRLWLERSRRGLPNQTSALPGQPTMQGNLDKLTIRAVVIARTDKIRFCYEKALLAKPGLAGTVTVAFYIQPDGTVGSSVATGVDQDVATCVADVIKTLEFPKPDGGGGVQVQYPFTFRPSS